MLTVLNESIRERLTTPTGISDASLFGATPGTFTSTEAGHATRVSTAGGLGETAGVDRGGSNADPQSVQSNSLAVDQSLNLSPEIALVTPGGTMRASVDVRLDTDMGATFTRGPTPAFEGNLVQPGAIGTEGQATYAVSVGLAGSVSPPAEEAPDPATLPEAASSLAASPTFVQPPAGAIDAPVDSAQIQALADGIRSHVETLVKLLPTLEGTVQDQIGGIQADAAQTLQGVTDQLSSTLDAAGLTGDVLSAAAPSIDASLAAVSMLTAETGDAVFSIANVAGSETQDIVQASLSSTQDVVSALGDTTDTVGSVLTGTAGSLLDTEETGLAGSNVGGGIATLVDLLQADGGFVVENAETGDTLFGSTGAALDTVADLAGLGDSAFASDDGDASPADSLLGVVTNVSDGLGGLLHEDEGFHG